MQVLASFDPGGAANGNIDVSAADSGCKILLYNLSLVAIKLNFEDGSTAILHAGEANYFELDGSTPTIEWSQYSVLNAAVGPISVCTVQLYRPHETIDGTYPFSLIYLLNLGNAVPLATSATSVANTGNAANTAIVASTVAGDGNNAVNITNDAQVTLGDAMHSAVISVTGTLGVTGNINAGTLGVTGNINAGAQIVMENGVMLVWEDNTDVPQNCMQVSNGNAVQILGIPGTELMQFLSSAGSVKAVIDTSTGNILLSGGKIGKSSAGDILDANDGSNIYIKANGGNIIFQSPNGTSVANIDVANNALSLVGQGGSLKNVISANHGAGELYIVGITNTNKIFIKSANGNNLMSIDPSGNVRCAGTLTQNVVP